MPCPRWWAEWSRTATTTTISSSSTDPRRTAALTDCRCASPTADPSFWTWHRSCCSTPPSTRPDRSSRSRETAGCPGERDTRSESYVFCLTRIINRLWVKNYTAGVTSLPRKLICQSSPRAIAHPPHPHHPHHPSSQRSRVRWNVGMPYTCTDDVAYSLLN